MIIYKILCYGPPCPDYQSRGMDAGTGNPGTQKEKPNEKEG